MLPCAHFQFCNCISFSPYLAFHLCLYEVHIHTYLTTWLSSCPMGIFLRCSPLIVKNHVLAGRLACRLTLTKITCPLLSALVRAFLRSKHSIPAKTKGRPRGRLHSDAQVNTGAKKQNVSVIVLVSETAYLVGFLTTLYIV